MMYGEVRRGILQHTACAVIPQAVRLSASEYGELLLTGSDSLPVPMKLTKAIVPDAIIARRLGFCKQFTVRFIGQEISDNLLRYQNEEDLR